jgi:hypothetical protein
LNSLNVAIRNSICASLGLRAFISEAHNNASAMAVW